jgi:hypothetical protein
MTYLLRKMRAQDPALASTNALVFPDPRHLPAMPVAGFRERVVLVINRLLLRANPQV